MNREKAIRHFERYVNDDCYTIEHREYCRMAIAALREQEERRWIPVSEKFPEDDGRYFCNVKSFAFPGSFYQRILDYDKLGFKEGRIYTDSVTHWMHLPEPPKEDVK